MLHMYHVQYFWLLRNFRQVSSYTLYASVALNLMQIYLRNIPAMADFSYWFSCH